MTRQDCFRKRAEAWLTYLRLGRTDLLAPPVAAEALRVALAGAGLDLAALASSETEVGMHLFNHYIGLAHGRLAQLRLGVVEGATITEVELFRQDLAKADAALGRRESDGDGPDLAEMGTSEEELRFFSEFDDPLSSD